MTDPAKEFAEVIQARLVPPCSWIIRFPDGKKIGPWASELGADEIAGIINSALSKSFVPKAQHEAVVAECNRLKEAAEKMYGGMKAVIHVLEYVHPESAKLFTDGLDAFDSLRATEGK